MDQAPEAFETAPLKALQELAAAGPPQAEALDQLFRILEAQSLLEHAQALLRQVGVTAPWEPFRARLKEGVARSRDRRMNRWQTDPNRKTLRFRLEVAQPICRLHPPALVARLARTFLDADLPLSMGLEKTPRPAIQLAHPLPQDVCGRGEWADAVFAHAAQTPIAELPGRINAFAPEGLRILACEPVPNYATPVSDLCRAAAWRWPCPGALRAQAAEKIAAFLASEHFDMEKPGKTGGNKGVKRVEIRSLVETMAWEEDVLVFRTRIVTGQAPNPRKLLAAILACDPAAVTALERTALELAEDPRLLQADRFEPKLHNMFEDAVLLDSGSHITLVEDDDDSIILGG